MHVDISMYFPYVFPDTELSSSTFNTVFSIKQKHTSFEKLYFMKT